MSPMVRSRYPADWSSISRRIRERSGGRCECYGECGLHCTTPGPRRCTERHGEPATFARGNVILTVAHLNHDPADCRPENLRAMCQRCHLMLDVYHHQKNAATTRRRKKGVVEMMFGDKPVTSSSLRFLGAVRRARPVGSIYWAWCDGRAHGISRKPPSHGLYGGLATWWLRGYRHGMREHPRFEQLSLFGGRVETTRGGAASALTRKPGRAAEGARVASAPGGAT